MIEKNKKVQYLEEQAVLVGVITQKQSEADVKEYLDELPFLAETAGAITHGRFTQKVDYPNPKTFVGKDTTEKSAEFAPEIVAE